MVTARKFIISILLGLVGFLGSFFSLNYFNPPFFISIEWCDAMPILAAMAFGGRYGLIAATLGLGAFYPLILWPNNGWASVVTIILLVLLYSAIGYFTGLRRKNPAFWNHPLLIYPLLVLIYNILEQLQFPIALSFNPPFWNPAAELSIPASILGGMTVKSILILNLLIIFDLFLLKLPGIQKLLGLDIKNESRNNGWINLGASLGSIMVWYIWIIFNRIFIDQTFPQGLFQIGEPYEFMALIVFLSTGFLIGIIICQYVESRLKAEDELGKSRESYRLIFEQAADGIFITDPQGNYVKVNDSACKLTGYTRSELLKLNSRDLVMPEEQSNLSMRVNDLNAGDTFIFERRMRHKDGSPIDVEINARRLADGRLQGLVRDVTDRKQAEVAIRESEARFRSLFDDSPISLWEEDFSAVKQRLDDLRASGVQDFNAYLTGHPEVVAQCAALVKVVDVNKATLNLFGAAKKEDMLMNLTGIFPEEGYDPFRDELVQIASGVKQFEMEHINQSLNGNKKIVNLSWVVIRGYESDLSRTIVSLIDITERKQAEEARYQSEENYRLIFEQAADGIFIADAQGNFTDVNPSGCALSGYTRGEILCLNMRDMLREESKNIIPFRFQQMKTGQIVVVEQRVPHKNGSLIDVEMTGRMLPDGRFQGVVRDISSRKRAEEKVQAAQIELKRMFETADETRLALLSVAEDQKIAEEQIMRLNAELELRVKDRTAQLEAANQELEAFAYSVSHDLKAPLRTMSGFGFILEKDYSDKLDDEGRNYLTRIQEAARRMEQLINDLLNLSRVTRAPLTHQRVDLSGLAVEISTALKSSNPQRRVEFNIAPNMVAEGDPDLLKIVLENLLTNAYKFTGQCDVATIQVAMTEQSGRPAYFVRDNGAGFDMAYADKLFAPFQRLHGIQEFPGTGIGLVTVRRIITRHGGRIWPEAAVGEGATFYFTLP